MRHSVTGGVRSGKSRHAEALLLPPHVDPGVAVTYPATGPQGDDADWRARVDAHRSRRPASWRTVESTDAASALWDAQGPVLLDCLGTRLTAQLDEIAAWEAPETHWSATLDERIADLEAARLATDHVVAVTNEVGWGPVSEHRSGRIFADRLGWLNQRLAASADRVDLVVSGQVLTIKGGA
ncbi:bifunctional adenosylcobinamide kinase/adenosylcobinamide-phosphate guanylyltransferase [Janibacter limosus]|uniref:Bifunctional adenosylcobinamide kinase/adenosylcobinamide-phosphate guanylyltransferase n=1 Tax=Janibacter limosus TaxID=53458 RepID=A0AC61U6T7_9MICO|nr:bifunctional adenosylcobinamide kinase/adenosylcobinamide-phosphate guanylyltransferase [Janibacter limosus]UUZ45755.1 bifunctional adenosylcobinamide kinase/adenosylcobinamide-phosphate guanylyltransferase [Janibacter limosus]